MKKFVCVLLLLSFLQTKAQVNEEVLADTIAFITAKVKELESFNYNQIMRRLNFEDCNLQYERAFKDDEDKWLIYDIWLADIDEEKMSMGFDEGGWKMILVSNGEKIEYDSNNGSGWVSEVHIYSADQAPLLEVGRALYYAIKTCKKLNRFKK